MGTIRQPGKGRMPKWIWREPKDLLPIQVKHFIKFSWKFGPQGCDWWNCVLARYFKVTPRTIRRWIHTAKNYPLIAIAYPDGRNRVIRRLPYGTKAIFVQQRPLWLGRLRRTQMSALDNASKKQCLTDPASFQGERLEERSPSETSEPSADANFQPTHTNSHPEICDGRPTKENLSANGLPGQASIVPGKQFALERWPGDVRYIIRHHRRLEHFRDCGCDQLEAEMLLLAEKDLARLNRRKMR